MAKESQFWALLKPHIPKEAHVQRIETGGTGRGVPDVNYCQQGIEIWIELKSIKGLKSELSPFQIAWIYNRIKAGGNCFVLIRKNKEIKLFQPSTLEEIQKLNWKSESALTLNAPYEWDALFKFILNSTF
tara:strand:+ start:187 stop:576 length:390 start_codon:yes stop_codon:yes gene_type:complete